MYSVKALNNAFLHSSLPSSLDHSRSFLSLPPPSCLQPYQQQKVTQFQLSGWTEEGLCTDGRAILELIELVAATQRRTGNNPIVIHGM